VVRGSTVQLAELSQELVDLPGEMRVLEATEAVAKYVRLGRLELTASSVLERLGFPAARQWTPVGQLSGGERRRLQLTRLLMAEPNVLLLDEPTNDLDVDTLARLEDLLDGWPGTLVVVSHDRYLVERVCDTVVALLGDGKVTHLPGGIEEYLARRSGTAGSAKAGSGGASARRAGSAGSTTPASAGGPRPGAEQRTARREASRLERRLETLAAREKALHEQMVGAATDSDRLLSLDGELRGVVAERESVELEWLEAAEAAE
jgi:ATP-binding cassette subfamily F protein uup